MKLHDNSKNKNRKMNFLFDSALCASFMKMGAKLKRGLHILMLFDDNKVKMARKPGKKQKEIAVACTGEGKR